MCPFGKSTHQDIPSSDNVLTPGVPLPAFFRTPMGKSGHRLVFSLFAPGAAYGVCHQRSPLRYLSTPHPLLFGDGWGDLCSEERHPGVWSILTLFTACLICTSLILPKPPFSKISVQGVGGGAGKLAENDLERTCALDSEAMGLKPN